MDTISGARLSRAKNSVSISKAITITTNNEVIVKMIDGKQALQKDPTRAQNEESPS